MNIIFALILLPALAIVADAEGCQLSRGIQVFGHYNAQTFAVGCVMCAQSYYLKKGLGEDSQPA